MSDYKQKNLVWYGMTNIFNDVCNCFSILNAYLEILSQGKCFDKLYKDYVEITAKAIETEMILKITRCFDRSQMYSDYNCSFALLKELCNDDKKSWRYNQKELVISEIESLNEKYSAFDFSKLRNKRIAHNDLDYMFNDKEYSIDFNDMPYVIFLR